MWGIISKVKKLFLVWAIFLLPVFFIYSKQNAKHIYMLVSSPFIQTAGFMEQQMGGVISFLADKIYYSFYMAGRLQELRSLRKFKAAHESLISSMQSLEEENIKLSNLLKLREHPLLPEGSFARVVSRLETPYSKMMRIDQGFSQAVHVKQPIVSMQGVVGQVMSISRNYADILLITDPSSIVEAKILGSNVRGIIRGAPNGFNAGMLLFTDFDQLSTIGEDEIIVTNSVGSYFPSGLPIGKIKKIKNNAKNDIQVLVEPFVDFNITDTVYLINAGENLQMTDNFLTAPWPVFVR